MRLYAPIVAGFVADAASVALYVPGDVIVQRLQVKDSPYSGFSHAVREIYRTDGVVGFFRGFSATFLTSGIASAVWWLIYENVKREMYDGLDRYDANKRRLHDATAAAAAATTAAVENRQSDAAAASVAAVTTAAYPSPTAATSTAAAAAAAAATATSMPSLWTQLTAVNRVPQLAAGFVAGTCTSALMNPLDIVKTRLQVQDTYGLAAAHNVSSSPAGQPAAATAATAASSTADGQRFRGLRDLPPIT